MGRYHPNPPPGTDIYNAPPGTYLYNAPPGTCPSGAPVGTYPSRALQYMARAPQPLVLPTQVGLSSKQNSTQRSSYTQVMVTYLGSQDVTAGLSILKHGLVSQTVWFGPS